MTRLHTLVFLTAAGAVVAGLAVAQGGPDPIAGAIMARKSHMQLYQHNIAVLGGMAQGNVAYDAAAASAAAGNLVALSSLNQMTYWPVGSEAGVAEGSRALPALWTSMDDVIAKATALTTAAVAMQAAAGTDLASLQAAMGALGGACGSCHESYRQPN